MSNEEKRLASSQAPSDPPTPSVDPVAVIVPAGPSDVAVRLECLRIALGRGLSISTPDSEATLRRHVDMYFDIVTGGKN